MSFIRALDDEQYLLNTAGEPFFVLGANYEGYFDRAWRMWDDDRFDPDLIRRDFRKMADAGLNAVRLFLQPGLERDVRAGKFGKLDRVLQLAADHNLSVLFTFNDRHSLNLAEVSALDAQVARRYRDDPVLLGWDLENEPVFYNFAAAIYPPEHPAPVQTPTLVEHYGPRVSQAEALELQRQRRIPAHLSPPLACYYINALKYFIEFHTDALAWAEQHSKTLVEYIYSNDSAKWHKLIEVLNGTVAAWLAARRTPVKEADPNHLITLGYGWLHFAALPANRLLDFQTFHKYGSASLSSLREIVQALSSLQSVFPNHPLLVGEFGYSNHTGSNPATSRPVSAGKTALFEGALLGHMRAAGLAGAFKWMLNDVETTTNPYEASFGIFRVGDRPKPIRDLLARFRRLWPPPPAPGRIHVVQDRLGLAYRLDVGPTITLGGGVYQDESLSWQADEFGHCFIERGANALTVTASGNGHLALDPWELVDGWEANRSGVLYRVAGETMAQLATFLPGERAAWPATDGAVYRLAMGAPVTPPPPEEPDIVPNPGEHVVLLPNADDALRLSLPYIRHFAPDVTFAPDAVAGRWPYVTVVASPAEIADSTLEAIRVAGAQLVERIEGDIEAVLAELVAQNRRFRTTGDGIPDDSPVEPPPPPPEAETYTVQPGDTLSRIALHFYGQSSLWTLIFEANRDILDDPARIRPGMVLKIPPKPAA